MLRARTEKQRITNSFETDDRPTGTHFFPGIIGCITVTTLHMNEMWWPSQTLGGALHKHLFVCLSMASLVNFAYALLLGPGFLPLGWQPEVS